MRYRLAELSFPARLAIALFCVLLLGFHVTAQATLWGQAGGGSMPTTEQVLFKYHGNPSQTPLHEVLDLSLPRSSPRAMFWYLDPLATPDALGQVEARRSVILDWVDAGAPRDGWEPVRLVLQEQGLCLQCHGMGKQKADVPLSTYEDVARLARPGQGITPGALLVSAHNHLFGFAIAALLLGVLTALSGLRSALAAALILAAFVGAAVDVGGWFLTAGYGAPWQNLVVLGGASFGLASGLMALLVLDEVALGGRVAARLRLGRARVPEPPGTPGAP